MQNWLSKIFEISFQLFNFVLVWIHVYVLTRLRFAFLIFFFFSTRFGETRLLFMYCSMNSNRKMLTFLQQTVHHVLFMDPQISLFSNFFIKNGSHGTIYTFKNYFATVISAINFQFQQNKSYPNRPFKFIQLRFFSSSLFLLSFLFG